MKKLLAIILISILTVMMIACSVITPGGIGHTSGATPTISPASNNRPESVLLSNVSLADLYDAVNPGVVAIYGYSSQTNDLGTGFVIDTNGHVITNLHVVAGESKIEVDFPSGEMAWGTVIAQDPDSDLAVIKVDLPSADLHPLVLGDSSAVRVGDLAVAIGNPFWLESTMTLGIISAKGRTMDSQRAAPDGSGDFLAAADLIQTDAAVNEGNSGGPLLNMKGEVIGMNRALISSASSGSIAVNTGIGLAVSSNVIRRVLPALIANGKYEYSYLGIKALPQLLLIYQEDLGLPYSNGVYVIDIIPGGPAAQAGLRGGKGQAGTTGIPSGGDLLMKINDHDIRDFSDMNSYLFYDTIPGETVTFTVFRDGKMVEVPVTLGVRS